MPGRNPTNTGADEAPAGRCALTCGVGLIEASARHEGGNQTH